VNQYQYTIKPQSIQLLPPGIIHSFKKVIGKDDYYHYVILFEKNFLNCTDILDFHIQNIENINLNITMFKKIKDLFEEVDLELKYRYGDYKK
jgi:hypothetical protein